MAYRVRRVIMVNLGTVQGTVSRRIVELDPRGGAAVIGPNGVGKTTTLRLIPLFYGALPSGMLSRVSGQASMIPFILPSYQSALVFEYERGPREEDVRLVVMRCRGGGAEVAEHRIFSSGYRRELFLAGDVFLDDEGTVAAAAALGVRHTEKLSPAEYRQVILGTRAQNQRQVALRRLSMDYSLGPKPLANLDMLVASVVKDDVNFQDLLRVVVDMVLDRLGGKGGERERGRLELKQSRRQIELWLHDRRACAAARQQEPAIQTLRGVLDKYHVASQARLLLLARACRLDATMEIREGELAGAIEQERARREDELRDEEARHSVLSEAVSAARAVFQQAKSEAETARLRQAEFVEKDARSWALKLAGLPAMQAELRGLRAESRVLLDQSGAVDREVDVERERLQAAIVKVLGGRAEMESPIHQREREARAALAAERSSALAAAAADAAASEKVLAAARDQLVQDLGRADAEAKSPAVPAELQQGYDSAVGAMTNAGERHRQAQAADHKAGEALRAALNEHAKRETALQEARRREDDAGAELRALRGLLAPEDGSLLASLRGSPVDAGKPGVAAVLNPELLARKDLEPAFDAVEAGLYGWRLKLDAIDLPEWANDDVLRSRISAQELQLAAAVARKDDAERALGDADLLRQQAEEAKSKAAAEAGLAQAAVERAEEALRAARFAVETAKNKARRLAADNVIVVKSQIRAADRELTDHRVAAQDRASKIEGDFADRGRQIAVDAAEGLAAIKLAIETQEAALQSQVEALAALRQRMLSERGVDVGQLSALERRVDGLADQVRQVEDRQPLVSRWEDYLKAGGDEMVERVFAAAEAAGETHGKAELALGEASRAAVATANRAKAAAAQLDAAAVQCTKERSQLDGVIVQLGGRLATGPLSAADGDVTVPGLITDAQGVIHSLRVTEEDIKQRLRTLKRLLTMHEGNVRDLIDQAMGRVSGEDEIKQAQQLVEAFKGIERQVVPQVGASLRTMLEGIGSFRDAIFAFESEVVRFNRALGEGLRQVEAFPRLKDLELSIITDFSELDIVRKVAMLDELRGIAKGMAHGENGQAWLPDDKAANAMMAFLDVLKDGSRTEINLASRVTIRGHVTENGQVRSFARAEALKHVSSTGLSSLVMITLLIGLLNMIRGSEEVHVAWITDEISMFDAGNLAALLEMLARNKVDVVTASPDLGPLQLRKFSRRYVMADGGNLITYAAPEAPDSSAGLNKDDK